MAKRKKTIRSLWAFAMVFSMIVSLMPSGYIARAESGEAPTEGLYLKQPNAWGEQGPYFDGSEEFSQEAWCDTLYGATLYIAYFDSEGAETHITDPEDVSVEPSASKSVCKENQDFIEFVFDETGDYTITYRDLYSVTIHVDEAFAAFYEDAECNKIIRNDYFYEDAEEPVYLKIRKDVENFDILVNYDSESDSGEEASGYIDSKETEEGSNIYVCNIKSYQDFSLRVSYEWKEEEENRQSGEMWLNIGMKQEGLMVYGWIDWEDDKPVLHKPEGEEVNGPFKFNECDIGWATFKFVYKDEAGESDIDIEGLTITNIDTGAEAEVKANEADNSFTEIYFGEVGEYKATYESSNACIKVNKPRAGFYSDEACENYIGDNFAYSDDDSERTVYFCMGENTTLSDKGFRINYDEGNNSWEENTDNYISVTEPEEGSNTYAITIKGFDEFSICAFYNCNEDPENREENRYLNLGMKQEGLMVYDWIDWEDDKPVLHEPQEGEENKPSKATYRDLNGGCFKFVYVDEAGETSVSADKITVTLLDGDGEADVKAHEKDGDFTEIQFDKAGTYKVTYQYGDGKESYVIIIVGNPRVAFFADEECSELLHDEFYYDNSVENPSFYLKLYDEFKAVLRDENPLVINDDNSIASREYVELEDTDAEGVYKVNVINNDDFGLKVYVSWTDRWYDGEEEQTETRDDECFVSVGMKREGLVCYDWIDWDNDEPKLHVPQGDEQLNPSKSSDAELDGKGFYFAYIKDGREENVSDVSKLSVVYEGTTYEIGSEGCPVKIENMKNDILHLTFAKTGDYKIVYKADSSFVSISVGFSTVGFYKDNEISDEAYLDGELEYTENEGAAFYCLINDCDEITISEFEIRSFDLDLDSAYDIEALGENKGKKVTLKEGINASTEIEAFVKFRFKGRDDYGEDEYEERSVKLKLYTESSKLAEKNGGRTWYTDGAYQQGFSGFFLTEYEFEVNNGLLYSSGDSIYAVHGETAQEVISKLDALSNGKLTMYEAMTEDNNMGKPVELDVQNTGYVQINVSQFGDIDLEAQYVATSGKLKGIIFDSSGECYKTVPSNIDEESAHALLENGAYVEDTVFWVDDKLVEMFPEIKDAMEKDGVENRLVSQYMDSVYNVKTVYDEHETVDHFQLKDLIGKTEDISTSEEVTLYTRSWEPIDATDPESEWNDAYKPKSGSFTLHDIMYGEETLYYYDEDTGEYKELLGIFYRDYVFPELHVNMYTDMKFSGVFKDVYLGYPDGSEGKAYFLNEWNRKDAGADPELEYDEEGWRNGVKYTFSKADISEEAKTIYLRAGREDALSSATVHVSEVQVTTTTDKDSTFVVEDEEGNEAKVELEAIDPIAFIPELDEGEYDPDKKAVSDAIKNGDSINVTIKADEVDTSDNAEELSDEIKGAVGKINDFIDSEDGEFEAGSISTALIDINIRVSVGEGGASINVTSTKAPLKVKVPIPKALRGLNKYDILRCHDGEVDVLEAEVSEDGVYIEFYSDRYSVYAIAAKKADFDLSNVKWDYTNAFTYDGKEHKVELTGLPEGLKAVYAGNTSTAAGKYKATVTFEYDKDRYNAPDTTKIPSLDWEIKKLSLDLSNVKWDYTNAFTYDGKTHTVALTGLPAGLTAAYIGNTATAVGKYEAKVTFNYDTAVYEAPDVSKLSSLAWEIKEAPGTTPETPGTTTETPGTTTETPGTTTETPGTTPETPATETPVKKGETVKDAKNEASYKVTGTGKNATVEYQKPVKSTANVKVPDTVKVNGVTYKVTSISANAFKGNKKITSVTIGKNIKTIGANAFYGCKKLKTVKMGANVLTVGKQAFAGCTKLTSVTIGSKVQTISDKAFYKCTALKKIVIPAKVVKIGASAFNGCKNLKTITVKSTKLKTVGSKAITGINKKAVIKVPKSKLKSYKKLFSKKAGFKSTMTVKK